jgi:hypothetical protein
MLNVNEVRGRYQGKAEIWVEDVKRFDVSVSLKGYVDVVEIKTISQTSYMDGQISWDGFIETLADNELFGLIGQQFEIRLPGDHKGNAVLLHSDSYVKGSGLPPFPVQRTES